MKIAGIKNDIKGVIFDMDGLLVNSEKLYWQANIQAAKEAGLDIPENSYLKLAGASVKKMSEFYDKYFPTIQAREDFIKRTDELVAQWTKEGKLKLQPGVAQFLTYLKNHDLKMGIASSNYKSVIQEDMKVTKIKQYFDFYLSYDDVLKKQLKSKPASDIYDLAQKRMGLPASNLVVFEDSSSGVQAAKNAQLPVIMIPDLKAPSKKDKENATAIYSNFNQVLQNTK
ncbi:HAD family phosphatase [Lactobacillus sp. PV037]|uniref:HAD family hydrolase n=1 Tax=unclassified Lactobacillus TaxID=2620435 RepID=UPI00223F33FB|nr:MULTISPECIES: HAD family phosphatase [unclassified Lactobacillus]QNQ82472.1 HAD family phosphatase [Lactobacillus sp. PV012]QNQ83414.1 HAD family phosphatase [Lactobacillus sp. PV037]